MKKSNGKQFGSTKNYKIAIIGQGYVGKAFKRLVENHYDVVTYDPQQNDKYPQKDINDCGLGVICVPTPSRKDGSCDTSIVEEAVKKISTPLILIKSTIEPGTTDRLAKKYKKNICFSPEYVGESHYFHPYWKEMVESPYLIVGGKDEDTSEIIGMLETIMGPTKTYYKCTALEAEIIKYFENSFFATKVTLVNEFYDICKAFGADWYRVREGWLLDPRVNRMHTSVFWKNNSKTKSEDKRGFGGKCYPKDVSALVQAVKKRGYTPTLLQQVLKTNTRLR